MGSGASKQFQSDKAKHAEVVLTAVQNFQDNSNDNWIANNNEMYNGFSKEYFKKRILLAASDAKAKGQAIDNSLAQLTDADIETLRHYVVNRNNDLNNNDLMNIEEINDEIDTNDNNNNNINNDQNDEITSVLSYGEHDDDDNESVASMLINHSHSHSNNASFDDNEIENVEGDATSPSGGISIFPITPTSNKRNRNSTDNVDEHKDQDWASGHKPPHHQNTNAVPEIFSKIWGDFDELGASLQSNSSMVAFSPAGTAKGASPPSITSGYKDRGQRVDERNEALMGLQRKKVMTLTQNAQLEREVEALQKQLEEMERLDVILGSSPNSTLSNHKDNNKHIKHNNMKPSNIFPIREDGDNSNSSRDVNAMQSNERYRNRRRGRIKRGKVNAMALNKASDAKNRRDDAKSGSGEISSDDGANVGVVGSGLRVGNPRNGGMIGKFRRGHKAGSSSDNETDRGVLNLHLNAHSYDSDTSGSNTLRNNLQPAPSKVPMGGGRLKRLLGDGSDISDEAISGADAKDVRSKGNSSELKKQLPKSNDLSLDPLEEGRKDICLVGHECFDHKASQQTRNNKVEPSARTRNKISNRRKVTSNIAVKASGSNSGIESDESAGKSAHSDLVIGYQPSSINHASITNASDSENVKQNNTHARNSTEPSSPRSGARGLAVLKAAQSRINNYNSNDNSNESALREPLNPIMVKSRPCPIDEEALGNNDRNSKHNKDIIDNSSDQVAQYRSLIHNIDKHLGESKDNDSNKETSDKPTRRKGHALKKLNRRRHSLDGLNEDSEHSSPERQSNRHKQRRARRTIDNKETKSSHIPSSSENKEVNPSLNDNSNGNSSPSRPWTSNIDHGWAEVSLLLRKPIRVEEDMMYTVAAAEAGLMFTDQMDAICKSLGVLRGTLSRWILPYDNETRIESQCSTPHSVVEKMPKEFKGKLTERQVHYLVAGANGVRKLVRIKIADDNDLEQARNALKTTATFFKLLYERADQAGITPFELLKQTGDI